MKQITLPQPHATLVGLGVQTIITTPWRPPATLAGQHVAIHAGLRHPAAHWPWPSGNPFTMWDGGEGDGCVLQRYGCHQGPEWPDPDSYEVWPMPLGAIVATARVVDCVPITGRTEFATAAAVGTDGKARTIVTTELFTMGPTLLRGIQRGPDPLDWTVERHLADQLHYTDFTPGRWAWLLDDAKLTTERCPACMGSGTTGVLLALCRRTDDGSDGPCVMKAGHSGPCYGEDDVASDWQPAIAEHCPTCLNYPSGTCPPIPVKGRPRLTEWTP